ncbi:MAG: hypothetical protein FWC57_05985, partial [Endomicrobia bacterium]|nr:hypothetical protein [Endomicrobiia bacterium]
MSKIIISAIICVSFAVNLFAAPIAPNRSIFLQGRGINSRIASNYYHSKGINSLVKISGVLYAVSLDQNNKIVIDIVNEIEKTEFFATGITAYNYDAYRGVGSVADDGENLYITYIGSDGSVRFTKISLSTKTVLWERSYKPQNLKYMPLDSFYYNGYLYILVCENETNYHVLKVSAAGDSFPTILNETNSNIRFNAIAVESGNIYLYGTFNYWSVVKGYSFSMYISKYDTNGNKTASQVHTGSEWQDSAITRTYVYNNTVYATYKKSNLSTDKILKMNDTSYYWNKNISVYTGSIYADGSGEYVGYCVYAKSGYQRYDSNGNLLEDKFVMLPANVVQSNAVCINGDKVAMFDSISNQDACINFVPVGKTWYIYNSDAVNFTQSALYPSVSDNQTATFEYRVKYVNYQNMPPASGYPKLYIFKNGMPVNPSGYVMSAVSGGANYSSGVDYSYSVNLPMSDDALYSYRIDCGYGSEFFQSDVYSGPFFGEKPAIYELGLSPDHITISDEITVKIEYADPKNNPVMSGYPKITVNDSNNIPVVNGVTMADTGDGKVFQYKIPAQSKGSYSYKIEAQNNTGLTASPLTGNFTVYEDPPKIRSSFSWGNCIYPSRVTINDAIYAQIKYEDSANIEIMVGYPKISIYDKNGFSAAADRIMSDIGSGKEFKYYIGKLAEGTYTYKIEAQNRNGLPSNTLTGSFDVLKIQQFFNYPNPFYPARGQKTNFVFSMHEDGSAKIVIYSEYGDKVWESETFYKPASQNLMEIPYDGRDNSGKMLYN